MYGPYCGIMILHTRCSDLDIATFESWDLASGSVLQTGVWGFRVYGAPLSWVVPAD